MIIQAADYLILQLLVMTVQTPMMIQTAVDLVITIQTTVDLVGMMIQAADVLSSVTIQVAVTVLCQVVFL